MTPVQATRDEQCAAADLSLPRRQGRDYIHSADIFRALSDCALSHFGVAGYVSSLVLRHCAFRQLRAAFQREPDAIGTFALHSGTGPIRGWLVESERPVSRVVPYDESRVIAAVHAADDSGYFAMPVAGYSAFEHMLVAMKVAGGNATRDAWLCQADFQAPFLDSRPVAVRLLDRLRLFHRFEIRQEGQVVGFACATWRSAS